MMATPEASVSVVIPTFNRLTQLQRTIAGLARQVDLDQSLEIVVVDDGSTDGTERWLRSEDVPAPVVALRQENSGPAAARNRGVLAASGQLIIFLDDDVIPEPGLVAAHVRHHAGDERDRVIVGPMSEPTDVDLSPWVRWEQRQLDKQYDAMNRGDWEATPRQFYTGNASVDRRHLLAAGGFNTEFRRSEDVELGYRLADAGLSFAFARDAIVIHHAERSFDAWRSSAATYGRHDVIFGRDQGHEWLLNLVLSEFHDRHPLVQGVTRLTLRYPRLGAVILPAANIAARTISRTGPRRLADAALSAIYNFEYYRGMAVEFGGGHELLERLDAAAPT